MEPYLCSETFSYYLSLGLDCLIHLCSLHCAIRLFPIKTLINMYTFVFDNFSKIFLAFFPKTKVEPILSHSNGL